MLSNYRSVLIFSHFWWHWQCLVFALILKTSWEDATVYTVCAFRDTVVQTVELGTKWGISDSLNFTWGHFTVSFRSWSTTTPSSIDHLILVSSQPANTTHTCCQHVKNTQDQTDLLQIRWGVVSCWGGVRKSNAYWSLTYSKCLASIQKLIYTRSLTSHIHLQYMIHSVSSCCVTSFLQAVHSVKHPESLL